MDRATLSAVPPNSIQISADEYKYHRDRVVIVCYGIERCLNRGPPPVLSEPFRTTRRMRIRESAGANPLSRKGPMPHGAASLTFCRTKAEIQVL